MISHNFSQEELKEQHFGGCCGDDTQFGIEALVPLRQQTYSKTHPPKARASAGIAECCLILYKKVMDS